MAKFLKTTFSIILILFLLTVIAVGAIVAFVSPNQFKPVITSQALKYTGRTLTIDGNLSWSFYPYLGFKAGHTSISNAASFKQKTFAEMNEMTVGIKLLPLLHGKIETSAITLSGLKLYLIKNANGTTNWQDLQMLGAAGGEQPVEELSKPASERRAPVSLNIPSVDISDSQIVWLDEQKNQQATISHFELHVKDINEEAAFPVASTFDFASKYPNASGQGTVSGQFKMDINKQLYVINGLTFTLKTLGMSASLKGNVVADLARDLLAIHKFTSTITGLKSVKQPIDMQGEIAANLNQNSIKLTNFVGKVANLTLNGNVNIANYKTATGHLQAQPFDLKALLQALGQDTSSIQTAKMMSADFNFSATTPTTAYAIQAVNLQGKIKLENLEAAQLKIANIVMQTQLQNGVLTLTPVTASLYQGMVTGNGKVNLAAAVPQISLQAQLANVQVAPLLQDLKKQDSKFKLKGAGNIDLQVTTAGLDSDSVVRNLNGTGKLSFKDGQVTGINVGYMIDKAVAIIKQQTAPANQEDVTNFGILTANVTIKDGVVTNNDLQMDSPRFTTKGQGTINLVAQKINYVLQATPSNLTASQTQSSPIDLTKLTIPVNITGNLSDPNVSVDTGAIIKSIAKDQFKKVSDKIHDKVRDQIKAHVPGQAGEMLQNFLGN
jgi:AsmA protein